MPWTFSHPAAVIPISHISKNKIPAIGLVIGSCSPDFGYYINSWEIATKSHSFIHSLYIALPICLILIFIIALLRDGILFLLPKTFSQILENFIPRVQVPKLQNLFWMIAAIIIGIYSHIIWDSFTHNPKYFRNWWPFISYIVTINGSDIPLFKLLQHASSVIGASLLFYWFIKAAKFQNKKKNRTLQVFPLSWQVIYCFCILIVSGIFSILNYGYHFEIKISELSHFLFINAVQGGILVFCLFLFSALILQIKMKLNR